MKLEVDQKIICSIDEKLIDDILHSIDENDWHVDDYRNKASNMENVNSIPIFHSRFCGVREDALYSVEKGSLFSKYYPLILPILDLLRQHYTYNYHASFLARLDPQSEIGIHSDNGDFLLSCHRVHVPIKTNSKVSYWIKGNEYYWKRGYVYEFNNTLPHGVFNRSDEYRVHLILNLYNLPQPKLSQLNKI